LRRDTGSRAESKKTFDSRYCCENLPPISGLNIMTRRFAIVLVAAMLSVSLQSAFAAEKEHGKSSIDVSKLPPVSDKKEVTYANDIKPIFDKSCVSCHGPEKAKAKLRLDALPSVLKGGEDGKVVEAGASAASVLVHNVAHLGDPDDYMPPPKNKAGIPPLTPEQIGLIRAWIDQGAH
jgi:mono/diheme cytochrome c family protein